MLTFLAEDAREPGDAGAASQVSAFTLHKSKLFMRYF
jgi:hypothetical protein